MTEFYKNLSDLCAERGTTVTQMLRALGLSTSKGTAWKNGSMPKASVANTIAEYFGVPVQSLFSSSSSQTSSSVSSEKEVHLYTVDESRLVQIIEDAIIKAMANREVSREAIAEATKRAIKKPSVTLNTELSDRLESMSEEQQKALLVAIDTLTRQGLL